MRAPMLVALAFATIGCTPAVAEEPCAWNVSMPEASTAQGHRVMVVFTEFEGQTVTLKVDDETVMRRALTTEHPEVGFSGKMVCRLEGRHWFNISVNGRGSAIYVDVDGPLQLYFSVGPTGDGFFAIWELPFETLLLD